MTEELVGAFSPCHDELVTKTREVLVGANQESSSMVQQCISGSNSATVKKFLDQCPTASNSVIRDTTAKIITGRDARSV